MITADSALALVSLTDDELRLLNQLDASVESSVYKHFSGAPFEFVVSAATVSRKVASALQRLYEGAQTGNWRWAVSIEPAMKDGKPHWKLTFQARACERKADWKDGLLPVGEMPAKARGASGKPRVCLVSDERGWAFDRNMQDLATALADTFEFEHFYVADWLVGGARQKWDDFDLVYECFHRNPHMGFPRGRSASSLRTQASYFRPDRPGPLDDADYALINSFRAFHVVTQRDYDLIKPHCPRLAYLTNPIVSERFSQTPPRDEIIAEWNGNPSHQTGTGQYVKHFHDVIEPACRAAGVRLVAARFDVAEGEQRRRSPEEMPEFYREATVALCGSEAEGASYSIMEAMASGLAVIATDVGNHREMHDSEIAHIGEYGILLVERSVEAFADALRSLTPKRAREMGEINRAEIQARWSWAAWKDRYADFLRSALP